MEQYYLGFDAGTQSVKTAVYDIDMNLIVQDTNATILNYPHPGWVEMDADQYLHATVTGIRNCVTKMKEKNLDPDNIRSIFGDGIICGIVGVDKDCHAITPYINYLDSRTKEDVEELASHHYEIWAKETGNPQPNCMFPAMFARWMMNNCEGFKEKGRKFMHNAPYILANLAGLSAEDAFIDWGTMSGWGLGYRVTEKKWSKEQLEILGIPMEMMPKIQKPWDIIGTLSETFAKETGLKPGIPICAGAGDTMQSMIGCGVIKPDQAADVAGTCAMFCIATDGINEELSKPENELIFNSGTLENTYFYWGFIRTGGLALRWYRDNVCNEAGNGAYFDELNEKAQNVPCGSKGVLFLPYLTGGFGETSNASACFLNMTMDTDQGVQWRAVLEAIGYDYMSVTDIYKKAGVPLEFMTITEGGSNSEVWNQIKADMLGCKSATLENAQGAVLTDAVIAAYAVGDLEDPNQVFEKTRKIKKIYEPDPIRTKYYRSIYEQQRKLIKDDMATVFQTLHQISKIQEQSND